MTVIMLQTGKRTKVGNAYGARLIEQGVAVQAPAQGKKQKRGEVKDGAARQDP